MQLYVVHLTAEKGSGPYVEMVDEVFNRAKRDDTEVVHGFTRLRRAADTVFAYPQLLDTVDIVNLLVQADRDGFDGAMVACNGDPGIAVARSLCEIPIVGIFEATLHLACGYGRKFGVVTVAERAWAEVCEMRIETNGLAGRSAGVRCIETPSKEVFTRGFGDPAFVSDEISKQANVLIEDGASVIVVGSAGLSALAAHSGLTEIPGRGVPVLDPMTCGLTTLEMRVDLTQKTGIPVVSRAGQTELMGRDDVDRVRALFVD